MDGTGGASCDREHGGAYICYTALEACPDSKPSVQMPGYGWSFLACGNRCTEDFVDFEFDAAGGARYVCDVRAADPGAIVTVYVLPPGARDVGQAVADAVCDFEATMQNALEDMYTNMGDETFKEMRRILPVTGSKYDWSGNAMRMAGNRGVCK